jgi:hypothetical protein
MKKLVPRDPASRENHDHSSRWLRFIVGGCLIIVLVGLLRTWFHHDEAHDVSKEAQPPAANVKAHGVEHGQARLRQHNPGNGVEPTAEEVVAGKVIQFARSRRALVDGLAARSKVEVPDEVKRFFDVAEAGRWEELDAIFKSLSEAKSKETPLAEALKRLWPAILDTYGAAEVAHDWPAQKLLDYGHTVLDSLQPDTVYVGGTDPGRWIPALLSETSEGEHRVVMTQNALADGSYLDYLDLQYHDRIATLTQKEFEQAFQDNLADVQKRLAHDQQFPDEPKQIRPNENISDVEGRLQVSGPGMVLAIIERQLQTLMQKNPDLSFALEESFPLKSTYADATPLGPLMELRAQDAQTAFTPERAAQTLDYWNTATQRLLSDPEAVGSSETLKAYSHDASAQANLLAAHNYNTEAEQAYRLSSQLWPASPEPINALSDLLARNGRVDEARQLVDDFVRKNPDQSSAVKPIRKELTASPPPRQ